MANLKDLAEMTGLSVNTVSRVIRGKGYISAKTAKAVQDAIQKIGYQPNQAARSLRNGVREIAVIAECNQAGLSEKLAGIRETCFEQGYRMRLYCEHEEYPHCIFPVLLREALDGQPSGIIFLISRKNIISRYMTLRKQLPCVWITKDPVPGSDCVSADYQQGASEAVLYLYNKGRRRIAFAAGSDYHNAREGYLQTVNNLKLQPIFIPGNLNNSILIRNKGYLNGKMFASMSEAPDGIITTDWMASGLIAGFESVGYSVPQKTALIALENTDIATMLNPSLTSLILPNFEVGHSAAGLLFKRIKKPDGTPLAVSLRMALLARQST